MNDLKQFADSAEITEKGRYRVNLPWKTTQRKLPNNYGKSLRRLKLTIKNLCNHPGGNKLEEYDQITTSQFQNNIIEKVEPPSANFDLVF